MIKRVFDILISIIGLTFLFPIIAITAFFVFLNFGLPILFKQKRPGYKGVPFVMYKFRSMIGGLDKNSNLLPDIQRLTKFGSILRSSSLDELPALWNVLTGDMSLVGPRPLLMEYLPLYSNEQARRHNIKPGITGWAQVNGRNELSWPDRFKLDIWYVDNQSLLLDLKIIIMTLQKVFIRDGVVERGQATMSKFTGNSK
ncbi:WcaJ Sugar transferases involved in lipopolysaccharide synthesis [Candidatus Methylopumilus universalis]|uniref:sugar transferase n=1 Tax=Candidatus Methylopumilus universalis TaxID=2588536 RepID=UPI003BEEECF0